nr:MAG TPA: hypothetical protein [Bacteriophage sp.]
MLILIITPIQNLMPMMIIIIKMERPMMLKSEKFKRE